MSIYYVRHGETDYNKAYLIQGSIDAPLNEVGMEQAHQIALKLKDIKFAAIYCSPLRRARQTAEPKAKVTFIENDSTAKATPSVRLPVLYS